MAFRSVPYDSLSLNPFTKIGKEWALLTAGDENGFNTMTVSWGAMGFMWGKPSVTVYIRPQRYTKEFVDTRDTFTLSFYPEEKKTHSPTSVKFPAAMKTRSKKSASPRRSQTAMRILKKRSSCSSAAK